MKTQQIIQDESVFLQLIETNAHIKFGFINQKTNR